MDKTNPNNRRRRKGRSNKGRGPSPKKIQLDKMVADYPTEFEAIKRAAEAISTLEAVNEKVEPRLYITGGCIAEVCKGIKNPTFTCTVFGVEPELIQSTLQTTFGNKLKEEATFLRIILDSPGQIIRIKSPHLRETPLPFDAGIASLDPKDCLRHQNFTVECLAIDPITGRWLDFFRGFSHFDKKILDVVDAKFLLSDSTARGILPYKAAQMAALFDLTPSPRLLSGLKEVVQNGVHKEIAAEQVWECLQALLCDGSYPEQGLILLHQLNLLSELFPLIEEINDDKKTQILGGAIHSVCALQEAMTSRNVPVDEHAGMLIAAFLIPIIAEVGLRPELPNSIMVSCTKNLGMPATVKAALTRALKAGLGNAEKGKDVDKMVSSILKAA